MSTSSLQAAEQMKKAISPYTKSYCAQLLKDYERNFFAFYHVVRHAYTKYNM